MKRKLLSLILCLSLVFVSFCFIGCDKVYSKEDVGNLYTSMKTDNDTKEFFSGDSFVVTFNGVNVDSVSDKGYIFPAVYSYYLQSSSCLLTGVIKRFSNIATISSPIAYSVKDFSREQVNDIYEKLYQVKSCLKTLHDSKMVYEMTGAKLHYQQVLSDYNSLISRLYSLNFAFSNYYFNGIGKVDFSKDTTELSDSNMRDMLGYVLLNLSKVTYNYEVLNYTPSNPLGEVKNSWIDQTEYMKDFLTLSSNTLSRLNSSNDLALLVMSNKEKVKTLFTNVQNMKENYEIQYNCFIKALNGFDAKSYFVATNKSAFLENGSKNSQSNFIVIENFLKGTYKALYIGLNKINTYM